MWRGATTALIALTLVSCNEAAGSEQNPAVIEPVPVTLDAMLEQQDRKVCAHPEVTQTATDIVIDLSKDGLQYPADIMGPDYLSRFASQLNPRLSMITFEAADPVSQRITCAGQFAVTGAGQDFDARLSWTVQPSVDGSPVISVNAPREVLWTVRQASDRFGIAWADQQAQAQAISAPRPAPTAATAAPSFNCGRASNHVERTICSDDALARLDREMVALHGQVRKINPSEIADQSTWLVSRNRCTTSTCIRQRYEERIAYFEDRIHESEYGPMKIG